MKWQLYDAKGQPLGSVGSAKSAGTGVAGVVDKSGDYILFRQAVEVFVLWHSAWAKKGVRNSFPAFTNSNDASPAVPPVRAAGDPVAFK